jgi:hypothetical protein
LALLKSDKRGKDLGKFVVPFSEILLGGGGRGENYKFVRITPKIQTGFIASELFFERMKHISRNRNSACAVTTWGTARMMFDSLYIATGRRCAVRFKLRHFTPTKMYPVNTGYNSV